MLLLLIFHFLLLHRALSKIHKGCNIWKDNTWERYGRTKYYESYPKPPLLEMEWENCDINVLWQANIPQFNRTDNIGTPPSDFLKHSLLISSLI